MKGRLHGLAWALALLALAVPAARADGATPVAELRRQAEAGDPEAQNRLGVRYVEGQGVERDFGAGVRWFRRAAEAGHPGAQYNLSVMYANGQGVRQDDAETVKWSTRAANQGVGGAQYGLGLLYAVGAGVPQDYTRAYMWFDLAAQRLSGEEREMAIEDRDLVAARMAPGQVQAARRLARQWQPRPEVSQ